MRILPSLVALSILVAGPFANTEEGCGSTVRVSVSLMLRFVTKFVSVSPEPHFGSPENLVTLYVVVGADGTTQRVRLVKGIPILVPKAMHALRQWEYTPPFHLGEMPVCFKIRVPVKKDSATTLGEIVAANAPVEGRE